MLMYFYGSEASFPERNEYCTSNGKKSLASLYIYLMLREKSSGAHPLATDEIIHSLKNDHGIQIGKQAVIRAFRLLADSDIHVFYLSGKGAWFDSTRLCA